MQDVEPVNERFKHLLDRAGASRLTESEAKELAELLNRPILAEPRTPAQGRPSIGSANTSVSARLQAFQWFSRCGAPVSVSLSMPIEQVTGWAEAMSRCGDDVWESIRLDAQNELTEWLHRHARDRYQQWNSIVQDYKQLVIGALTRTFLVPYQQIHRLPQSFVHAVEWDILGALMADHYLPERHECFFFLELLLVYEAGHFPCGWRGDWPEGRLVVY